MSNPEDHPIYSIVPNLPLVEGGTLELVPSTTRLQKGELIFLYFSAHWCPPCKQFTPILKKYTEFLPQGMLKVIFVSRDRSEEEAISYFKNSMGTVQNGWYMVAYNNTMGQSTINTLCSFFEVQGIPSLNLCAGTLSGWGTFPKNVGSSQLTMEIQQHVSAIGLTTSNPYSENLLLQGSIRTYSELSGAYSISRLPIGQKVRIVFLKSKPELHGALGEIIGYSHGKNLGNMGRYLIEIKQDEGLRTEQIELEEELLKLEGVESGSATTSNATTSNATTSGNGGASSRFKTNPLTVALKRSNLLPVRHIENGLFKGFYMSEGHYSREMMVRLLEGQEDLNYRNYSSKKTEGLYYDMGILLPVNEKRSRYICITMKPPADMLKTFHVFPNIMQDDNLLNLAYGVLPIENIFLPINSYVVVDGLSSKPEINGHSCIINGNLEEGRFNCKLGSKDQILVKKERVWI